ncbi:MAG TPA: type II/IV secretion system ATPase subunit [Candidatus Thermoplasmatota archaeon]|nr:type II/IV secretion system ATPase subunit [Candidatus Thermoplasmatota archaeon]
MADQDPQRTLEEAVLRNPHLKEYLDALAKAGAPAPRWVPAVTRDLKGKRPYDLLYPVGDPIFIHLRDEGGLFPRYRAVMPEVGEKDRAIYDAVRLQAFLEAPAVAVPEAIADYRERLDELLAKALPGDTPVVRLPGERKAVRLTRRQLETMRFLLYRDLVEHGEIEPVMHDPWIEDIHAIGTNDLHVVHKVFGMVQTNLRFPDVARLDRWIETMGERMGRPVSASRPIVDGALPNGSRINIIYSDDISKGGSSFTIRKFSDTPTAVTQLIAWGTYDARVAAYLWLCLQNGMSCFVAGETASGKTTTTNAILPFIKPKSKIMTAEDTPEVLPPHANWQQLITRDRGTKDSSVTMYDLLKAGLRSRPNYIIVGEIRGAEGAVAFQAMQTGHPTMATFHASSVGKLIQRFTSDPINVPLQFMPNLNVVLIQMAVYVHGKMLRRVLAVEEIEGYSKRTDTAITRQIFSWDSVKDKHLFAGRNNSYVLETLVAPKLGFDDRRDVYRELDKRTWILEEMVRRRMFDYQQVKEVLFGYAERGDAALPFPLPEQFAGLRAAVRTA